jgi:hypothetical protein
MSDCHQWADEFGVAAIACRDAAIRAPIGIQLQGLIGTDRILSDVERAEKRFFAWTRLVKSALMFPRHISLSTEHWPSPFDLQMTKRGWEASLLALRQIIREDDVCGGAIDAYARAACIAKILMLHHPLLSRHPCLSCLLPVITDAASSSTQWRKQLRRASLCLHALSSLDHTLMVSVIANLFGHLMLAAPYICSLLPRGRDSAGKWEADAVTCIMFLNIMDMPLPFVWQLPVPIRIADHLPTSHVAAFSCSEDCIGGVVPWNLRIVTHKMESLLSDDEMIHIFRYLCDVRYMQALSSCCKRIHLVSSSPETWSKCYIIGYRLADRLSSEAVKRLAATLTCSRALCCRPSNCWWTHKLASSVLYGSTYSSFSAFIGRECNHLFAAKDIQFQTCSLQIRRVAEAMDLSVGISVGRVNDHATLMSKVQIMYETPDAPIHDATEQIAWLTLYNLQADIVTCTIATPGYKDVVLFQVPRRDFRQDGVHDIQICWSERVLHVTVDGIYFEPLHLSDDSAPFTNWAYVFGRAGFGRAEEHFESIHVRSRYHTLPVCNSPPPADSGRWLSGDVMGGSDARLMDLSPDFLYSSCHEDLRGGAGRWNRRYRSSRSLLHILSDDDIIVMMQYLSELRQMQSLILCCTRLNRLASSPQTWSECYVLGYILAERISSQAEERLCSILSCSGALCCRPPTCWWTQRLAAYMLYGSTYYTLPAIIGWEHNHMFAAKDIQFQTSTLQLRHIANAVDISVGLSIGVINDEATLLNRCQIVYGLEDAPILPQTDQLIWITLHNLKDDELTCSITFQAFEDDRQAVMYRVPRKNFRSDGVHDVQLCWSDRVFQVTVDGTYFEPVDMPEYFATFADWAYVFGRVGGDVPRLDVRSRYHPLADCYAPPPADSGRWRSPSVMDMQGGSDNHQMDCSPAEHFGWPDPLLHMVGKVLNTERPSSFTFHMTSIPEVDSHRTLRTCEALAQINPAVQDASLSFESEAHVYTFRGKRIGLSVTGLIHKYSEPFDAAVALMKMKSGRKWPRAEYMKSQFDVKDLLPLLPATNELDELQHLLQQPNVNMDAVCDIIARSKDDIEYLDDVISHMMMSDDEILQQWEKKRDTASNAGTWMHAMFEHVLNGTTIEPRGMQRELDMCISFLREHSQLRAYRTEWAICAPEEDLAGSIDLVLHDPRDDQYVLVDWKRSEKLPDKYNGFGKFMMHPAETIPDCQGQHYRLQLNIYKWMLSKYYNVSVKQMLVVCTHSKYYPSAFVDEVPDLQNVVDLIMRERRSSNEPPAISPTLQFQVDHAEQVARADTAEEDLARASQPDDSFVHLIERMMEESEEAIPEAAKKRRLMKGANESQASFDAMFQQSMLLNKKILDDQSPDIRNNDGSVLLSTRKYLEELRLAYPGHGEQLYRLILLAAFLSESRLPDRPMVADIAALVWMLEGDRYLRVHKGFLYIYTDNGAFVSYAGTPPESVLFRVTNFFIQLEGMLRRLRGQVQKDASSVARAIIADRQSFHDESEYLEICKKASREPKGRARDVPVVDHEDEGAIEDAGLDNQLEQESWTQQLASKAWKLSHAIKFELMHTRVISLLVEWCETPDQRQPGVCYDDVCMVYDRRDADQSVMPVKKSASNDCYVYIPHCILDPVLQSHQDRLQRFYSQTFWCNHDVFQCCQAALAIAKRGFNVDRCFIGQSPGGVGQSLFSQHIAEMYKHNHAFFDPNIWHNEEELRKQVEAFARCCILTGQEAPESAKKLHTDLYKKTMSGDGITGRKPYGYTTRMFSIVGWKRLEVNKMMSFQGVTLGNFNSILRRALVWKPRARFVHPQFLEKYPDHERDGFFPSDPSLSKFLSTDQASVAGIRLQHAFEATHSKDNCYELIENYVNGGDSYLTEDMMRTSCSMPVRERHTEPDAGIAAVVEADGASQEQRDQEVDQWKLLVEALFQKMLANNAETLTYYEFKRYSFAGVTIPNLSKDKLWDHLIETNMVARGVSRQKACKDKDKSGCVFPKITFAKTIQEVLQGRDGDPRMTFEEQHDVAAVAVYADGHTTRATNRETMLAFHDHVAKQAGNAGRAGRRTAQAASIKAKALEEIKRLQDYQKSMDVLLSIHHSNTASAGKRRRLTKKESASEKVNATLDEETGRASRQTEYHYADGYTVRGRRYAYIGSAQLMPRRLQFHALESHTIDLDICNCCPTILHTLIKLMQPSPAMPEEIQTTLQSIALDRAAFIRSLGVTTSEGKQLINTVLNGGCIPDQFKTHSDMLRLHKLSLYLRWFACNALYEDYTMLGDKKSKTFPSATALHVLWTAVEDWAIGVWAEYLLTLQPAHMSLHFDGIRVSHACTSDIDKLIQESEQVIAEKTGFSMKIAHKKQAGMVQLFKVLAETVSEIRNVPKLLLQKGNCIPCAIWHIMARHRAAIEAGISDTKHHANAQAAELGYRDYRSTAKMFAVNLMCAIGVPSLQRVNSFVMHTEGIWIIYIYYSFFLCVVLQA